MVNRDGKLNTLKANRVSTLSSFIKAVLSESYNIIISKAITSSYDIKMVGASVSCAYNIIMQKVLDTYYNIHIGKSVSDSYTIPEPHISLTSSYDIPWRTDSITLNGFEFINANFSHNGVYDISPYTARDQRGLNIIVPQDAIGYSNTFDAITLTSGDITYIKDTLARGWYTLNVFGELFEDCIVTSLRATREPNIDYYRYNVGVAQDTRFLISDTTTYDSLLLTNSRRTDRMDSGITSVNTGTISGNRTVGASPKVAWSVSFECFTDNVNEIPNIQTKLNKRATLVYNGSSYPGMVITSLSVGNTYTGMRSGVLVTMTEYSIGFTQDTRIS